MWVLDAIAVSDVDKEAKNPHYLLPGCYTVGRTPNVSDLLCAHNSISRKHALIEVQALKQGQPVPEIQLTDLSRYGTLLNEVKMGEKVVKQLTHCHPPPTIMFGFKHKFRLTNRPVQVFLSPPTATSRDLCNSLGFAATDRPNEGWTHVLLESTAVFSPVVALALLTGTPLITADWKDALLAGLTFSLPDDLEEAEAVRLVLEECGGRVAEVPGSVHVSSKERDEPLPGGNPSTSTPRILAALLKATTEGLVQESPPQAPADSNETDYIEDSPEPEKSPRSKARSKATPKAKPRGKPSTAAPTPNTAQARGRQLQSNDGAVGEGGVSPRPPKAAEVGKRGRTEEGPAGWGKRGGVAVAQSLKQEREVTEELVDRKPAFKKVKTEANPQEGDDCSSVVFLPLIVKPPKEESRSTSAASGDSATVNFKAFRRHGQPARETPFVIECKVPDAVPQQDNEAFQEAEKAKRMQNQKNDELFEAKPAGGKAAARKPARKPK